jgi:general secretion pathway protein J
MSAALKARRSGRTSEAGFTLVELLVALALFGLLSVALFGSIRMGMASWTRGTARADQVDQTLHAQNLLRGLIEEAYPLFLADVPAGGHADFAGTSQSLDFLAPTPIARGVGGRSRFRIAIARSREAMNLVLTSTVELAWPEQTAQPITTVLLAGVADVQFSYFGAVGADRAAAWHDAWRGQASLPQLLRVRVRYADGDSRNWPELLIAPRITADVSCVYDPLTNRCRGR